MEEQANSATTSAPRRITTSGVLALLNEGKSRKEIKEIFNVSNSEMKVIFDSPSLKGKRTKKSRRTSFILEDDLAGQAARVVNPAPTPTPAPTPAPATPTTAPEPEPAPAVNNATVTEDRPKTPAPEPIQSTENVTENVETSTPASRTARPSTAAIPVEAAQAAVPEIPVAKQEDEWGVATEAVEEQPDDRPKFDL